MKNMIKYLNDNTIEVAKISGIYVIINRKSNMFYIGESFDIKRRWKEHIDQLRNNTHDNFKLLQDYQKYGEDSFEFKLLQPHISYDHIKTACDLLILENEYIQFYSSKYNLYNIDNTLELILQNSRPISNNPKYSTIVKTNLIKRLLTTDIIWIENSPCIIELPNIDQYMKGSSSQIKKLHLENIIPKNIQQQCITIRKLSYVDTRNTKRIMSEILVKDEHPLVDWLLENKYTTDKYINEGMKKFYGVEYNT